MMDKKNAHRDRYHPRDQRPKNDSSEAMPPKHPAKAPPQKPKIFNSMFLHDPTCLPGRHGGQVKRSNGVGPGKTKQNKEERRAQKQARNRAAHLLALEDATTDSVDGKRPEEQVRIHREPETSTSHLEDHVELHCEPGTSTSHLEDHVKLPGEPETSNSHLKDHVELPKESETSASHFEDHVELSGEPGTSTSHLEDHVKLPGEPETSNSHLEDHVELSGEPGTSTSHLEDHVDLPGEAGTSTSQLLDWYLAQLRLALDVSRKEFHEQNIENNVLRADLRQVQEKLKSQSDEHDQLLEVNANMLEVVKSKEQAYCSLEEQVKEKVTMLKNALVTTQNQLKAKDVELEQERSSHAKKKPLWKRIHQWFTRKTKH